jgi:hypothetical protein
VPRGGGIGFESLGLSNRVPGNGADNGADSLFVNVATYGDATSQYPLSNAAALVNTSLVGDLSIPEFLQAVTTAEILFEP